MRKNTPSEFYKIRRQEYFSDSEIIYESKLQREHLAYELSQITTNQKQDEFETLCRKLSEIFIAPNLIPQVGPTGGGDGKTDSETYPVSQKISERWFIPENGWSVDEKWAFAISAKQTWKSKAKSDIKKIIGTEREYTRVYFFTNQTPSSKKKKDAQDEFIKEFQIDVVILDGEWILEKIYTSELIDLVVDSLNLSPVYKNKTTKIGKNDTYRIDKLEKLEKDINSPNRYFEYDFQLVEDSLEAAILTRMLEKPRDEVEGKFDRAFRFAKKINYSKLILRIHYQRAWTYLHWYDDYPSFIEEFKSFKKYISETSSITNVELYFNLINLLSGLNTAEICDLSQFNISLDKELIDINLLLDSFIQNEDKPCSSLIAKTYKSLIQLTKSISEKNIQNKYFTDLTEYLLVSEKFLDFPFESFKSIFEELGNIFPNLNELDKLIDVLATISSKRNSDLASAEIFLNRGGQKLFAGYHKESIIYFGKAVLKLAKEETQYEMYFALIGLSQAYNALGLIWASNNSLISASKIAFKQWYESGIINKKSRYCAKQLAINELLTGRIPIFLNWYGLFNIVSKQLNIAEDNNDIKIEELLDGCLANRILNTNCNKDSFLSYLPRLFEREELWLATDSCLYKLGYIDLILDNYKGIKINGEKELDTYFTMVAHQPFVNQMMYDTNLLSEENLNLSTTILGCIFCVNFKQHQELLFATETILAFFESFFATSLEGVYPKVEQIVINLKINNDIECITFHYEQSTSKYSLEINESTFSTVNRNTIWENMIEFTVHILIHNFLTNKDPFKHIENLFENEELNERLSIIFEHRNFLYDILGDNPKLFLFDWADQITDNQYPTKRKTPLKFESKKSANKLKSSQGELNYKEVSHNKRKVLSIIDIKLWDIAKWQGFGVFSSPSGIGVFLGYQNKEAGKKIFDDWIKKVGKEDVDELIKITIIKGVNKNNPFWYRVHITINVDNYDSQSNELFISMSRIHEMNAPNSKNLDILLNGFKAFKQYQLCPASMSSQGSSIEPYYDKSILKKTLFIRNAWEIGENDWDCMVIKKSDSPIIPANITDAPILQLLKKLNS